MNKKLLVLLSLIMILTGALIFTTSAQMIGQNGGDSTGVTWTDPTCDTAGSYTYNVVPEVTYLSSRDNVTWQADIFTNIKSGDTIWVRLSGDESEFRWTHTFSTPNCLVDPDGKVVFTAPTCDKLGYYTITAVTGISYYIGEDEDAIAIAAGSYTVKNGTSVVITAKANPGYYLPNNVEFIEFRYTFTSLTNCVTSVAAATPKKLPLTSGDSTIANVTILSTISAIIVVIAIGARKILVKRF